MPGPYAVEAVANSILRECEHHDIAVDPMKLQKLIYMAHGYYVGYTETPLIDEYFEAWPYGPVVPSVYHEFKRFGGKAIATGTRALNYFRQPNQASTEAESRAQYMPENDRIANLVLNYVVETYGKFTATYLSALTHKVGSPWHQTRESQPNRRNTLIPDETIQRYFAQLV